VPSRAVHEEDDRYVVYVTQKGGKPLAREVRPGRTDGDNTEILSGLREGEEILLERPGAKGSKKGQGSGPESEEGGER
jgi:multidrug efflux pump subunit AcrA (membrane-fusion protein)